MKQKQKAKCFQMPIAIYASLPAAARQDIRDRLIACGYIRTVETLNKFMHKSWEE